MEAPTIALLSFAGITLGLAGLVIANTHVDHYTRIVITLGTDTSTKEGIAIDTPAQQAQDNQQTSQAIPPVDETLVRAMHTKLPTRSPQKQVPKKVNN